MLSGALAQSKHQGVAAYIIIRQTEGSTIRGELSAAQPQTEGDISLALDPSANAQDDG